MPSIGHWVTLEVPLLLGVKETPQVFEHIALHADDYIFGHLNATRTDDGLLIRMSHALLGDYLDEENFPRGWWHAQRCRRRR